MFLKGGKSLPVRENQSPDLRALFPVSSLQQKAAGGGCSVPGSLCVLWNDDVPLPLTQGGAETDRDVSLLFSLPPSLQIKSCSFPPAFHSQFAFPVPSLVMRSPGVLFPARLLSARVATLLHNLILRNTPPVPLYAFSQALLFLVVLSWLVSRSFLPVWPRFLLDDRW